MARRGPGHLGQLLVAAPRQQQGLRAALPAAHASNDLGRKRAVLMNFMSSRAVYAVAGAGLIAASTLALAQKPSQEAPYPSKSIRMIVPFAPGGGTDIIGRLVAQELIAAWGQPVIVDNRGGSGGTIGTNLAAKSTPDGYTMVLCSLGLTYATALYRDLPYDARKDLTPISRVASQPFVYVVTPSIGVSSMKELIALARSRPGELRYGSGGAGGASHLGTELLRTMTGIDMVHVPYKGTAPALTAMLAGEIHVQLIGIATVLPHIKAGRMRALAVSGARRSAVAPELPTVAESGVASYEFDVWYGMLFPAGTPHPIVDKVNAEINRALKSLALGQRFAALGLEPAGNTREEFAKLIRSEIAKWHKVVQAAKIRIQ
ncbi:MAG: tripartite tricarboxylate transporter substrate binding protein [Betaproteobacteria bacterium]|nr:tripartite tricarboxylate transporter substrate binding protein [Betaproteobacteria bacterium]